MPYASNNLGQSGNPSPVGEPESSRGVATHVVTPKVVLLGHTDQSLAFVHMEEDLKWEFLYAGDRAFLEVLREAAIAPVRMVRLPLPAIAAPMTPASP